MKLQFLAILLLCLYQVFGIPLSVSKADPRQRLQQISAPGTRIIATGKSKYLGEASSNICQREINDFYFVYQNVGYTYLIDFRGSPMVRCSSPDYYPVFFKYNFNDRLRLQRYYVTRDDDKQTYPYAVIFVCDTTNRENDYVYSTCERKE